jgi:hypothetical protein
MASIGVVVVEGLANDAFGLRGWSDGRRRRTGWETNEFRNQQS